MKLICYSKGTEKIWLKFWPCRCDETISWEEWHQCSDPLIIYETDYTKLLLPYFQRVFPLPDPTGGDHQNHFDVCGENWIDKSTWYEIIAAIHQNATVNTQERVFYRRFNNWIQEELKNWEVIEVEGNL